MPRIGPSSILLAVLLAAAAPPADAHVGAPHHATHIEYAWHEPFMPPRGDDIVINLQNEANVTLAKVTGIYCRVQRYACGPALNLTPTSNISWQATVPWNAGFFRGVTAFGYKFEITYENGSVEPDPRFSIPERHPDLPPEGDDYYFVTLPPPADIPGAPLALTFILLAAAALRVRRGR